LKLTFNFDKKFSEVFLSLKIPFFQKTFRVFIQLYDSPNQYTFGFSAKCKDSRYVLFADYDDLEQGEVEKDIIWLQKFFNLGDFYLFQLDRPNSFHAICLDKFSLRRAYSILKESCCDTAFVNSPKFFKGRSWVLRFEGKGERKPPKFLKILEGKNNEREKSTAHRVFLEKWYSVPVKRYFLEDNEVLLNLVKYNTANRTQAKN